jgi:hypothetical protein
MQKQSLYLYQPDNNILKQNIYQIPERESGRIFRLTL